MKAGGRAVEGAASKHHERAGGSARIAWFATLGCQTERDRAAAAPRLPPPVGVRAERGRGHVTITWSPVEGAAGYLVHRASNRDGPFEPIDQHGGDVLAVPHGPYLDTTAAGPDAAWYAVASIPSIEAEAAALSLPVEARPGIDDGRVSIRVDASQIRGPIARPWRPMIGSEHLALLLRGSGPGGRDVGGELTEALRIARRELGVEAVRAHAILHDSLGVCRVDGDRVVHDFAKIDLVVDRVLAAGLRPIVELSFMPAALATDPDATVFAYRGIISPPRDHERWAALVRDLVGHLADRYGRDSVSQWAFEVWNEPNLHAFWTAAESDYLLLYEVTARAVKAVDDRFRVGGPATAAAAWIDDLLDHCASRDVPIDFVSSHSYGLPPLDLRPATARFGRPDLPLLWTEWGVSPTHSAPINDSVWGAPLVARGMRSAAGRIDALSYWVASDHFVELGEAPSLFHGGFGLLTIGNLRKPRFWAIAMLERLGEDELASVLDGRRRGLARRGVGVGRSRRPDRDRGLERDARPVEGGRESGPSTGPVTLGGRGPAVRGATSFGTTGSTPATRTSSGPGSASAGPTGRMTPAGHVSAQPTASRPSSRRAGSAPTEAASSWSSSCRCRPCRSSSSCPIGRRNDRVAHP